MGRGRQHAANSGGGEGGTVVSTDKRATETVPSAVGNGSGTVRVEPGEAARRGGTERFGTEAVDRAALAAWLQRTDSDSCRDLPVRADPGVVAIRK